MANALSTAGIKVKYAVEATAGTRPTSGYAEIHGVKVLPAFGSDVNTLQSTPLEAVKNHTYIQGLSDSGGAFALTVNDYETFRDDWEAVITAYKGLTGDKKMWIEIAIPNHDSFYFPAEPVELGFGGAEVDSILENTANLIPVGDYLWGTASTSST